MTSFTMNNPANDVNQRLHECANDWVMATNWVGYYVNNGSTSIVNHLLNMSFDFPVKCEMVNCPLLALEISQTVGYSLHFIHAKLKAKFWYATVSRGSINTIQNYEFWTVICIVWNAKSRDMRKPTIDNLKRYVSYSNRMRFRFKWRLKQRHSLYLGQSIRLTRQKDKRDRLHSWNTFCFCTLYIIYQMSGIRFTQNHWKMRRKTNVKSTVVVASKLS